MPGLVEILIRVEGIFERRAAGCALFHPKIMVKIPIQPEIDLAAKAFFKRFYAHKDAILQADESEAFKIALRCCSSLDDFFLFHKTLYDINAAEYSKKIAAELTAIRTVRKAARWIEENGILKEGIYDG